MVGLPPAPRGVPQIEVTFDIDANGIVHVGAKDKSTGKEQSITIQSSGGLSESQIEQMVNDAENYAESDKERKAAIDARNDADSLIYSTEKSVSEYKDKLPQDVVDSINSAIVDLRGAMEGENAEDIKTKTSALQTAAMKIGESLNAGGGKAEGGEGGTTEDADVNEKSSSTDK